MADQGAVSNEQSGEQTTQTQMSGETGTSEMQSTPQPEGRRTQLKIVREGVDSLSRDVGTFRKNHDASLKRLESQISSLRREFSSGARAKDLASHDKNHQASNKRLEKELTSLRSDVASLKSKIESDAARSRAKQEALLAKILAKVSQKPKTPAKASATSNKTKKKKR